MFLLSAVLLAVAALMFTLLVRAKDVPEPEAPSPSAHLEQRKAQIYENLRDLQFEYRVGKLSDEDYQKTKVGRRRARGNRSSAPGSRSHSSDRAPTGATTRLR